MNNPDSLRLIKMLNATHNNYSLSMQTPHSLQPWETIIYNFCSGFRFNNLDKVICEIDGGFGILNSLFPGAVCNCICQYCIDAGIVHDIITSCLSNIQASTNYMTTPFLTHLKHFIDDNDIEVAKIDIYFLARFYCFKFLKKYHICRYVQDTWFVYLFTWGPTTQGKKFWIGHNSKLLQELRCLTIKKCIIQQLKYKYEIS